MRCLLFVHHGLRAVGFCSYKEFRIGANTAACVLLVFTAVKNVDFPDFYSGSDLSRT